jgi:hypothetical protein
MQRSQREDGMQLYTFNITDLTTYDSPAFEEWMNFDDVGAFARDIADRLLQRIPELERRGLCIAVYDQEGISVSLAPLDSVQ